MNRKTWYAGGGGLVGVALLASAFAVAHAQQKALPAPPDLKKDRTKMRVELPTEAVLAKTIAVAAAQAEQPTEDILALERAVAEARARSQADYTKKKVERPTEDVLVRAREIALAHAEEALAKAKADKGFVNPKVPPGKVTWHNDFAAACAASAKSGKPVLLFQMMGKLDDKFC